MSAQEVYLSLEFTPNPSTLKYAVNVKVSEFGTVNFLSLNDAKNKSPLAEKLFEIEGIIGVMFGEDFVTITKSEQGEWDKVHRGASTMIESYLQEGKKVFSENFLRAHQDQNSNRNFSEIETKIQSILDQDIRPAVAQDGGDIVLDRFDSGIVYLQLKGSCNGCPSSTATLKHGVEKRLKQLIPEVSEVVAV